MSVDNATVLFMLITYLITTNIGYTLGEECTPKSTCSCALSDGEGYDLSHLAKKFDNLTSTSVPGRTFYFYPCKNKPVFVPGRNTSACSSPSGVSLCLYNEATNTSQSFGLAEDGKMVLKSADSKTPQLVFNHIANGSSISVSISLVCSYFSNDPTIFYDYAKASTGYTYSLALVSEYACKVSMDVGGLSTGSVLVIILFVFSGLYFGGGALALKLLRGATGWEMLPNQKFWFDLPVLVREGIAFTFNGCKVVSYDQI